MWLDIDGWVGLYQVSDTGLVRSADRKINTLDRLGQPIVRHWPGRTLKPCTSKKGYLMVSFTGTDCRREYRYVHDLVLRAFRGEPKNGQECCHNNGIRADNRLPNLRWGTRKENSHDRYKHGTMHDGPKGDQCGTAKLTAESVRWVRSNVEGLSRRAMARKLGVSHTAISDVIHGRSWTSVQ